MFSEFGSDYNLVETEARANLKWANRAAKTGNEPVDNEGANYSSKKHKARLAFAAYYRAENARLRKSCTTCGNLVQPHLLGQHYEAYHPSIALPSA